MDSVFDSLDEKASRNISVSSIIIALITTLNLNGQKPFSSAELILITGLYVVIFILSYIALTPKKVLRPLKPTWEEAQRVLSKSHEDYYDWVLATYIDAIAHNQKNLDLKATFIKLTTLLLGADIVLIVIAAIL